MGKPAGRPVVQPTGQARRDVQERSSLTTFNKLRPEQSLTDKGGGGKAPRLGSRFCACAERADVFANMLALELTLYAAHGLRVRSR